MTDRPPTGPLARLGARWDSRAAEARATADARAADHAARRLARVRRLWARSRERLATAPVEHVRHVGEVRLPVPADAVWHAVLDPAGPLAAVYGVPLAAGPVPGPPPDAVGGRSFVVRHGPDGTTSAVHEVVHVEPGRRISRRMLHHPRRVVAGWWVEPDGDGCLVRTFVDADADRRCAWQTVQVAEAEVRRALWFVARALAGPAYAPDPAPLPAPVVTDAARTRVLSTEQLTQGPRVAVEAASSVTLPTGVHAAWLVVCSVTSPVVEHGDPEAWWFPLTPVAGPGAPVLRGAVSRHPIGRLSLLPYEVVAAEPGVALCTRDVDPFGPSAEVELTPVAEGTRVDVRIRQEVLQRDAARAHTHLLARAWASTRRVERHALAGPRPPLDDVWFP